MILTLLILHVGFTSCFITTPKSGRRILKALETKKSKTEFGLGGNILTTLALVGFLKSRFLTQELRTTTMCPSGPGSDVVLKTFQTNDPDYHCLPLDELAWAIATSPPVFPDSPQWDSTVLYGNRGLPGSAPLNRDNL